jgi:hypothetical protein
MRTVNSRISENLTPPTWLETAPTGTVPPPTVGLKHELPWEKLPWEDFERLCLRLARMEGDVESCRLYGVRGDSQEGIDLFAKLRAGGHATYQCKRVREFSASDIRAAVQKFIDGDWSKRTRRFVLAVSLPLTSKAASDAIIESERRLEDLTIEFVPWDAHALELRLKSEPRLVDEFFGRGWVTAFCGTDATTVLRNRLDAVEHRRLRERLRQLYANVFSVHDPGLPSVTSALSLRQRYVVPDVLDATRTAVVDGEAGNRDGERSAADWAPGESRSAIANSRRTDRVPTAARQRLPVSSWLASSPAGKLVVLGGAGSGKSTLLRYLILDLLDDEPALGDVAAQWGTRLPIWIPFAQWTHLLVEEPAAPWSIRELLERWCKTLSEEQLWPLIEQALDDDRLLLLVDGLDEWRSEDAAHTALAQLQVFVSQRVIPVVVTSRPHGFARLGVEAARWQVAELADLTTAQQLAIAQSWFRLRAALDAHGLPEGAAILRAEAAARDFVSELARSEDLRTLAVVPLLLTLLTSLRLENAFLPESRFQAYEQLVELLVRTHPRRRRAAAALASIGTVAGLRDDDITNALSALAYEIQVNYGSGVIQTTDATRAIELFLRDADRGLAMEISEARRTARDLVEFGEDTIGLLVKKSPHEVGFFHRAFQEYLTAFYLSRAILEEQVEIAAARAADPQWREVLLTLVWLARRPKDVQAMVDAVRGAASVASVADAYTIRALLAEIAFGAFTCPAPTAREVALSAFRELEAPSWAPQRRRLVSLALLGLRSPRVQSLVATRLRRWFPKRSGELVEAIGTWTPAQDGIECLVRALGSESAWTARTAASAIARFIASAPEVCAPVLAIANSSGESRGRAAALEALESLSAGDAAVANALAAARLSAAPELRLVGIRHRVTTGTQDDADLAELVAMLDWDFMLDWSWHRAVPTLLELGWSQQSELKQRLLGRLDDGSVDEFSRSTILGPLASSFPGDDVVAERLVAELRGSPAALDSFPLWKSIGENFRNHPALSAELERRIQDDPGILARSYGYAAVASGSTTAKRSLIAAASNESRLSHWFVRTLLGEWGMDDPDVASALTAIAYGPDEHAAAVARLLPKIIADSNACRRRLHDLLVAGPKSIGEVVAGLGQMKGDQDFDTRVVTAVLDLEASNDTSSYRAAVPSLLFEYRSDGRLRRVAIEQFDIEEGAVAAAASAFGDDKTVRERAIERATPLHADLRLLIAEFLGAGGGSDEFALPLLRWYTEEDVADVRAQAATGYHRRLRAAEGVPSHEFETAIDVLRRELLSRGPDHAERRQAAFCGLANLGRLDVLRDCVESVAEPRPVRVPLDTFARSGGPFTLAVLEHWDEINSVFDSGTWYTQRHQAGESGPGMLLEHLAAVADDTASVRTEALDYLAKTDAPTANLLGLLARTRPRSNALLESCVRALETETTGLAQLGVITSAAEILGAQFFGNGDALRRLLAAFSDNSLSEALLLALCEAWPDHPVIDRFWAARHNGGLRLRYVGHYALVCRKGSAVEVEGLLDNFIYDANRERPHRFQANALIRPLLRRLRDDDELSGKLRSRALAPNARPSERASLPRLLSAARGQDTSLREWCRAEVSRQHDAATFAEMGFDLLAGEIRPVEYSLLDLLDHGG